MKEKLYDVVAIIPARGGSKGLPRKNVMPLCGKPLIAYSIEAALASKYVDRVVVSTDDQEVAEVSKAYGAEVPFIRPAELSHDTAQLGDVLRHTMMELYQGRPAGTIQVSLLPTHPFRSVRDLDEIIKATLGDHWMASTVRRLPLNRYSHYCRNPDGSLAPLLSHMEKDDMVESYYYYRGYGLVGAHKYSTQGVGNAYFKVVDDPISLIDIDTIEDFRMAELVVENDLFDFKG